MNHRSVRGSVSMLVVVLGAVILLLAALVYDEGEILTARSRALAAAGEAARAGSRALTPSIREGGVPSVDPGDAAAAATAFLDPLGYRASVSVAGNTVTVTAARQLDLGALGRLLDIPTATVRATAAARAARGVRAEDQ